ncbi:AAA family ATPase [Thermosphaera chiliense]|uniref:AAA family ATPase n=1 Tax=Thermosphaera chiliense TaxID=3402707 RepID=A0A7M1US63_9CREN|nr:AAA family ATPase [Thermosphaera aggregans]
MLDVDILLYVLPEGVKRNSLIIVAGEGGAGKSALLANIAKSVIKNNEPLLYLGLDDDPATIVDQLSSFNVDIEKVFNEGRFGIIDGFSYLIKGKKGKSHPMVLDEVNPSDLDSLVYSLLKHVDSFNMRGRGMVMIDSLNEIMITLDPTRIIEFVKTIRANVAKHRSVTTIATLHTSTEDFLSYLLSIEHLVDGIIEMQTLKDKNLGELQIPLRQMLVRKMKGVPHRAVWTLFTIDKEGVKPVVIKTSK